MTVVSHTSLLLNLTLIERLHHAETQFDDVVVLTAVWDERTTGSDESDRLEAFRDWGGVRVVSPEPTDLRTEFEREFDRAAAVRLHLLSTSM